MKAAWRERAGGVERKKANRMRGLGGEGSIEQKLTNHTRGTWWVTARTLALWRDCDVFSSDQRSSIAAKEVRAPDKKRRTRSEKHGRVAARTLIRPKGIIIDPA